MTTNVGVPRKKAVGAILVGSGGGEAAASRACAGISNAMVGFVIIDLVVCVIAQYAQADKNNIVTAAAPLLIELLCGTGDGITGRAGSKEQLEHYRFPLIEVIRVELMAVALTISNVKIRSRLRKKDRIAEKKKAGGKQIGSHIISGFYQMMLLLYSRLDKSFLQFLALHDISIDVDDHFGAFKVYTKLVRIS
jgi:hypothetical protein